ncbi:hypothetical protein [Micromonospora sp. CP22]|uniref:hypothetical protein n=1 Tax=Micromonospora sp. CP22 TaxID=2580517 RepID=UPI0018AD1492|nr:hypothetical protein [Micromonospora sp. CP22]
MISEVTPPAMVAVLRGLAANAALDMALLRPLLDSFDLLTLVALAEREDLTRAAAMALARRADPTLRRSLARNPVAAMHVWSVLVADPDRQVRCALARGHSRDFRTTVDLPLPEAAQRALAHDPDDQVRHALAYRPNPAMQVGLHLAADPSVPVRRAVAQSWRPLPDVVARALLADSDAEVRRGALLAMTPPPDLVTQLLADPETRQEAAEQAPLNSEDAAVLVTDPNPAVREAAARNRHTPLAMVLRLGRDPDEDVRAAAMLHPDLPDEAREQIAASVDTRDYHVADWLLPHRSTLAERLKHVDSRFVFCRRAVAFSPDLPTWAVARLAADEDYSVRLLLAENHPEAPADILPDLIRRAGHARWNLVNHPNMPAHALAEFAASGNDDLRRVAATSRNLPATAATQLATHDDHTTRHLVAANPALPLPEITRLLHDPDPQLAEAAAHNPHLPPRLARQLIASGDASLPKAEHDNGPPAAGHPPTPDERTPRPASSAGE